MSDQEPNAPGSDVMKTKATGGTSGRYSGLAEYELNLDISLQLRDKLQEKGYDVIMTREDNDTPISNAERARMANEAGADIAIRIHANGSESSDANGALVLIGSAENPMSEVCMTRASVWGSRFWIPTANLQVCRIWECRPMIP